MAKKPAFDPDSAFKTILSIPIDTSEDVSTPPAKRAPTAAAPAKKAPTATVKNSTNTDINKQRTFYITDTQMRAIKKMALDKDTDYSSIVRESLDIYLKKYL